MSSRHTAEELKAAPSLIFRCANRQCPDAAADQGDGRVCCLSCWQVNNLCPNTCQEAKAWQQRPDEEEVEETEEIVICPDLVITIKEATP